MTSRLEAKGPRGDMQMKVRLGVFQDEEAARAKARRWETGSYVYVIAGRVWIGVDKERTVSRTQLGVLRRESLRHQVPLRHWLPLLQV